MAVLYQIFKFSDLKKIIFLYCTVCCKWILMLNFSFIFSYFLFILHFSVN